MGRSNAFQQIRFQPDSGRMTIANISLTLGSVNTVTVVDIPDWANGFRLYPSGNLRFAVDQTPTTATSSNTSVGVNDLGVGGFARGNTWEVRVLALPPSRTLHILALAGGETVDLEFF